MLQKFGGLCLCTIILSRSSALLLIIGLSRVTAGLTGQARRLGPYSRGHITRSTIREVRSLEPLKRGRMPIGRGEDPAEAEAGCWLSLPPALLVLHCTVRNCTLLHCSLVCSYIQCTVLYSAVIRTALYSTVQLSVLHCTIQCSYPHCTVQYRAVIRTALYSVQCSYPYYTALYCTVQCTVLSLPPPATEATSRPLARHGLLPTLNTVSCTLYTVSCTL